MIKMLLQPDGFYGFDPRDHFCSIGDAIGSIVGGVSSLFGGGGGEGSSGSGFSLGDLFGSGSSAPNVSGGGSSSFLGPSLLSAGSNALGSYFASANQAAAAQNATAAQLAMFGQTQTNLLPFIQSGQGATSALSSLTGLNTSNPLTSSLLQAPTANLSQSALEQTPGYQFTLGQGLQTAQNSFAANGLAKSGAAIQGAEQYATGLADQTYQQQYSNQVTNQTNQFDRLMSLAQTGQNSAANLGAYGTQTGSNIGSNIIGGANAGSAAITSAAGNVGSALQLPYLANTLQGLYGNNNGG